MQMPILLFLNDSSSEEAFFNNSEHSIRKHHANTLVSVGALSSVFIESWHSSLTGRHVIFSNVVMVTYSTLGSLSLSLHLFNTVALHACQVLSLALPVTMLFGVHNIIGVRANIHLGGQTEFCPNGFGGGGSSRNFSGSIFRGVPEFFPVTPVTDPKFVFFPR